MRALAATRISYALAGLIGALMTALVLVVVLSGASVLGPVEPFTQEIAPAPPEVVGRLPSLLSLPFGLAPAGPILAEVRAPAPAAPTGPVEPAPLVLAGLPEIPAEPTVLQRHGREKERIEKGRGDETRIASAGRRRADHTSVGRASRHEPDTIRARGLAGGRVAGTHGRGRGLR